MNKSHVLLTIGLMVLPVVTAHADPQISVSGSAEIKVAPDEVDLRVAIETRDENLQTAKDNNDKSVADTLKFLKDHDVKEKDIQTDFITVEPVYNDSSPSFDPRTGLPYARGNSTKPNFYLVSKTIGIKLTNVADFDMILTGLITNGVNVVQGIEFRTSELRKYKDQARAAATKAARGKAEAAASALGVKVGKPDNITINDWGGWSGWPQGGWGYNGSFGANAIQNVSQNAGGGPDENGATFAVGQISVSANVNVSFLIQ
jgi:uncharacterized protein YggE